MNDLFGKIVIVVMRERFVLVGQLEPTEDALFVRLVGASVVRRWGTSRGLGELAREGPRPNTKLDPEGDVILNKLEASRVILCSQSAWRASHAR